MMNIIEEICGQFAAKSKKSNLKDFYSFPGLGSEFREMAKESLKEPRSKISAYPRKIF